MMQCKDLLKYTYHVTTDSRIQTHSDLGVFLSSPQRSVPLGFPTEIKKSLMQTLHQKKFSKETSMCSLSVGGRILQVPQPLFSHRSSCLRKLCCVKKNRKGRKKGGRERKTELNQFIKSDALPVLRRL